MARLKDSNVNVLEGALRDVVASVEELMSEAGAEAIDGLYSIYEGSEELSCFTAKRLKGRRDKVYGKKSIFRS